MIFYIPSYEIAIDAALNPLNKKSDLIQIRVKSDFDCVSNYDSMKLFVKFLFTNACLEKLFVVGYNLSI